MVGWNCSEDIKEYLETYAAEGYRSREYRRAKCACGGETFELFADDDEGCAKRICISCGLDQFICDSADYWPEARLKNGSV